MANDRPYGLISQLACISGVSPVGIHAGMSAEPLEDEAVSIMGTMPGSTSAWEPMSVAAVACLHDRRDTPSGP
jgi:hypothetical protein